MKFQIFFFSDFSFTKIILLHFRFSTLIFCFTSAIDNRIGGHPRLHPLFHQRPTLAVRRVRVRLVAVARLQLLSGVHLHGARHHNRSVGRQRTRRTSIIHLNYSRGLRFKDFLVEKYCYWKFRQLSQGPKVLFLKGFNSLNAFPFLECIKAVCNFLNNTFLNSKAGNSEAIPCT